MKLVLRFNFVLWCASFRTYTWESSAYFDFASVLLKTSI